MLTKDEMAQALRMVDGLHEYFGKQPPSQWAMTVYVDMLNKYGLGEITAAAKHVMENDKYYTAAALNEALGGTAHQAADKAYSDVLALAEYAPLHNSMYLFPDAAAVEAVRRMGGIEILALKSQGKCSLHFRREDFVTAYQASVREGFRGPTPMTSELVKTDYEEFYTVCKGFFAKPWTRSLALEHRASLEEFYAGTVFDFEAILMIIDGVPPKEAIKGKGEIMPLAYRPAENWRRRNGNLLETLKESPAREAKRIAGDRKALPAGNGNGRTAQ
jgi:hypothetical protein